MFGISPKPHSDGGRKALARGGGAAAIRPGTSDWLGSSVAGKISPCATLTSRADDEAKPLGWVQIEQYIAESTAVIFVFDLSRNAHSA